MAVVYGEIDCPHARLASGDTHVYSADLGDAGRLECVLTEEERARASRFRLGRVRDQFVAARGQLRLLLGHYLGIDPTIVPIWYADGGKPYLPPEYPLHFNVSHTDGLAVYAFGFARVGVDVERFRPVPDADSLVARFFSRHEADLFRTLPPDDRLGAFFRAWTRKEAVLKAIGRGVRSLDCCDVTFLPGEPPRLLRLDDDRQAGAGWEIFTWEPATGYVAAGAAEVKSEK
jgi:4'-phosphopantetheinyl transferase